MRDKVMKAEDEMRNAQQEARKLRVQLAQNILLVEQETKLRLMFEEKLNYLHSLNRTSNRNAGDAATKLGLRDLDVKAIQEEYVESQRELEKSRTRNEELEQATTRLSQQLAVQESKKAALVKDLEDLNDKHFRLMKESNDLQKRIRAQDEELVRAKDQYEV